jgi:hypothetical protein
VSECNRDVQGAEQKSKIVALELASKYSNFPICIQSFEDSNGRMCRLNTILPKYAGAVVAIGINPHERRKYTEQAVQANRDFTRQERDDISWEEQTSHGGLCITILQ